MLETLLEELFDSEVEPNDFPAHSKKPCPEGETKVVPLFPKDTTKTIVLSSDLPLSKEAQLVKTL